MDDMTVCYNCDAPIGREAEKCERCDCEQYCTGGCGGLLCDDARRAGRDCCFSCAVANAD